MEITENLPNIEPIKPNEKSSSNMDARLAQLLCMLTETTQSCTQMLNEMNRKQKEEKENLAGKKASNANWHCTWDVGTGFISGLLAFTSGGQTASQAVTGITHGGDSVFQNNGSQLQEESQK
ncbi:MAG: hypothetical protein KDK50_05060, partial [Chlamydiia bacterium]|nr:hypothetical protein [Chlamydiia bacterium]